MQKQDMLDKIAGMLEGGGLDVCREDSAVSIYLESSDLRVRIVVSEGRYTPSPFEHLARE